MKKVTSACCNAPIMKVVDFGSLGGQLGLEKLRFCSKCKIILEGEGVGNFYKPKSHSQT